MRSRRLRFASAYDCEPLFRIHNDAVLNGVNHNHRASSDIAARTKTSRQVNKSRNSITIHPPPCILFNSEAISYTNMRPPEVAALPRASFVHAIPPASRMALKLSLQHSFFEAQQSILLPSSSSLFEDLRPANIPTRMTTLRVFGARRHKSLPECDNNRISNKIRGISSFTSACRVAALDLQSAARSRLRDSSQSLCKTACSA